MLLLTFLIWLLPVLVHGLSPQNQTFSWPANPVLSYATALKRTNKTSIYAGNFQALSTLAPLHSTTSWPIIPTPTDSALPYGNVAWSALWSGFNTTTPLPFTTTVSATPVPSSELVKPPPLPYNVDTENTSQYKFPEAFFFGFAGSAMQVEGGPRFQGRGPSIIETESYTSQAYYDSQEGGGPPDVAALNYLLYKQDIARLAAVGIKVYPFSISWTRILPFGVAGTPVNQEAIDHYDDLINTVLEYGMTPMVTLVHFDVPLPYKTNSSWQGFDHPDFIDGFFNYAQIVVSHYADRVPLWISFNEPNGDSALGSNYKSAYNIVMAHSKIVNWYRSAVNGTGKWSLKLQILDGIGIPLNASNPADVAATYRYMEYQWGYFANALYLGKNTPSSLLDTLGDKAPSFTAEELLETTGTSDFFSFDVYVAEYISAPAGGIDACASNSSHPLWPMCVEASVQRNGWDAGYKSNTYSYFYAQHLRTVLEFIWQTYKPKGITITEFGFPTLDSYSQTLDVKEFNLPQANLYTSVLAEVLKSIVEDGINVMGVIGWAYVDNWEFGTYAQMYGVQTLNRTTLVRTYKRAIFDVVDFIYGHQ